MSIVGRADERPDSPEINANLNEREYVRKFRVQTNDLLDGPVVVTAAPGIPLLYSAYVFGNEADRYALLREISAERAGPASYFWIVTCTYKTPPASSGSMPGGTERDTSGANDNPLLMLPEVETSFEKFQEVIYYVYDFATQAFIPCKATNGQVFDPPPTRDASRLTLTITRNEDINSPHPAVDVAYIDSVNSDVFWGCGPGTWKCMGISTKRETKQLFGAIQFPYLKVTYKFEARPTWDTRLLDAGAYWLDKTLIKPDAEPFKRKFITDDGHPRIGALDGFGGKLRDGAPPVFLTFRLYFRKQFAALNLPQSFAQVS